MALPVAQAPHSALSQNSISQDSRSQDLESLPEGLAKLQQSCDTPRQRAATIPVWQPIVALGRLQGFGLRSPIPAPAHAAVRPLRDEASSAGAWTQAHFHDTLIAAWFALTPGRLGKEFMDQSCWGHFIPYESVAAHLGLSCRVFLQHLAHLETFALECDSQRGALTFRHPLTALARPVVNPSPGQSTAGAVEAVKEDSRQAL